VNVFEEARVVLPGTGALRCVIYNKSPTGMLVRVATDRELPETFHILTRGKQYLTSRLVRREGGKIAVELPRNRSAYDSA
jgi:hypothetical protein